MREKGSSDSHSETRSHPGTRAALSFGNAWPTVVSTTGSTIFFVEYQPGLGKTAPVPQKR